MRSLITVACIATLFPTSASPQYLARLVLSPETQLVVCVNPPHQEDYDLFERLTDLHTLTFVSLPASEKSKRLLAREETKEFLARKGGKSGFIENGPKTIYLINDNIAGTAPCFPMSEDQQAKLQYGLSVRRQYEHDVAPIDPEFKWVIDQSVCQPVFDIPLDGKTSAVIYRFDLETSQTQQDCLSKFLGLIEFEA